jgi:hypothetical protein
MFIDTRAEPFFLKLWIDEGLAFLLYVPRTLGDSSVV